MTEQIIVHENNDYNGSCYKTVILPHFKQQFLISCISRIHLNVDDKFNDMRFPFDGITLYQIEKKKEIDK